MEYVIIPYGADYIIMYGSKSICRVFNKQYAEMLVKALNAYKK